MASAPSTPGSAPRTMSTKLLTMKFMQRGAAASPSGASSPDHSSLRGSKGKKDDSSVDVSSLGDQRAVKAALAAEEAKRQAALDRAANAAGDTRWVLSFRDEGSAANASGAALRIIPTGYAIFDADVDITPKPSTIADDSYDTQAVGRRRYGPVEEQPEEKSDESSSSGSNSSSDGSSSDSDDSDDIDTLITSESKNVKRKKDKKPEPDFRGLRGQKLGSLRSFPGRGGAFQSSPRACHKCGEVGHLQASCPKRGRGHDNSHGDEDRRKRARKSG